MKLFSFVNFQFMQFDLWVLSDVLKVDQAIIQMKTVLMNSKNDDNKKKTIHILYLHNNLTLKVLWKCLRFGHIELNIRKS